MREISINQTVYQLPEDWSEVDREKLPELLRSVFVTPESGAAYHVLS